MDPSSLSSSSSPSLAYGSSESGRRPSTSIVSHDTQNLSGSTAAVKSGDEAGGGAVQRPHGEDKHVTPKIRRRNRMITSCLECRRRKLKCDRLHPCTNCSKLKRDCLFLAPALDNESKMKLTELKEKMGSLERDLEQDVASRAAAKDRKSRRIPKKEPGSEADKLFDHPEAEDDSFPDDEKHLEPTSLVIQDAVYDDEADDDAADLGFKMGKMRMTDRVGGFVRPRIAEEVSILLDSLDLNRRADSEESVNVFTPGPSFIAPGAHLFFGGASNGPSFIHFLPSKVAADRLIQQYWDAVDPIAKVVHRPSLEAQYDRFWSDTSRGIEPSPPLQALIFAALFSAAASMPEDVAMTTFGSTQKGLIENFRLGTEMALGRANFLGTTSIKTLQALVMYMIPMCRDEISRAHSVLVGAAIRLAECMGFHRDPEEYGLSPIETHVRRMIWYQLCFLDYRTSDLQGPRPTIRREDFATKFPLNVDDRDIADARVDSPHWTDMTITRIRFECVEMHRALFHERQKLFGKQVSLTHVLGVIEAFRKAMEAKYGTILNRSNPTPLQRTASLSMSVMITRMFVGILHPYHHGATTKIPDRLLQVLLTAATQSTEDAIELETSPDLLKWAWYARALQQFHAAFLLLTDIYLFPNRRDADRVWRCMDYVFETSSIPAPPPESHGRELTREELMRHRNVKGSFIMRKLKARMEEYRARKKMRVPVNMKRSEHDIGYYNQSTSGLFKNSDDGNGIESSAQINLLAQPPHDSIHTVPPFPHFPYQMPSVSMVHSTPQSQPTMYSYPLPTPLREEQQFHPYSQQQQQQQHQQQQQQQQQHHQHQHQHQQSPLPPPPPPQQQQVYGTVPAQHEQRIYNPQAYNERGENIPATGSDNSGGASLWFLPPGVHGSSAGTAPQPIHPQPRPAIPGHAENVPMLEIDWNEWNKIFPPETNTGDINFPTTIPQEAQWQS